MAKQKTSAPDKGKSGNKSPGGSRIPTAEGQSPEDALKAFAISRGLRQPGAATLKSMDQGKRPNPQAKTQAKPQALDQAPGQQPSPPLPISTPSPTLPQVDDTLAEELDPKTDFSPRQLRFLDLYFSPGKKVSEFELLHRAGYKPKNQNNARKTAKQILDKFCARTDPREIFRRVGLSEQSIATRLLALADDPQVAAGTRVQALSIASKCLGLQREVIENGGGARIVICSAEPEENEEDEGQEGREQGEGQPIKAISIVK